jgi:hypothetical protein
MTWNGWKPGTVHDLNPATRLKVASHFTPSWGRAKRIRNGVGKFAEYGSRFDFENFGMPGFPMTWGVQNHQNFDWDSSGS